LEKILNISLQRARILALGKGFFKKIKKYLPKEALGKEF